MKGLSTKVVRKYAGALKGHKFKDKNTYIEPFEIGYSQDRGNGRVISCVANLNKIDEKDENIVSRYKESDVKDNLVIFLKDIIPEVNTWLLRLK